MHVSVNVLVVAVEVSTGPEKVTQMKALISTIVSFDRVVEPSETLDTVVDVEEVLLPPLPLLPVVVVVVVVPPPLLLPTLVDPQEERQIADNTTAETEILCKADQIPFNIAELYPD